MTVIERWTDEGGAEGVFYEGRLSITAKPSMTNDDGRVIVGIDAPWIDQLQGAVDLIRELDEMLRPMPPFNPVRVKVREWLEGQSGV